MSALCPVCIGKGEIAVTIMRCSNVYKLVFPVDCYPMECFACEGSGLRGS